LVWVKEPFRPRRKGKGDGPPGLGKREHRRGNLGRSNGARSVRKVASDLREGGDPNGKKCEFAQHSPMGEWRTHLEQTQKAKKFLPAEKEGTLGPWKFEKNNIRRRNFVGKGGEIGGKKRAQILQMKKRAGV